MTTNAKPGAADSAGHRKIQIADFRPLNKNTLRGFFSAMLPSGLVFHDLMLHERDDARWVGFPAREWTDKSGVKQYVRFIEFRDRETANRFRDEILTALDEHLKEAES
ncbi:MAG TPA: hypothetical protein VH640_10065 [Bryobacteraceae bacterium]|jgi:DMSO/TMAO reductase YedYZ molybdopterin-dependent catalytic subunit